MMPESMPVFTPDDIFISETEYEDGKGRFTSVGWLKELFLYQYIDDDRLVIEKQDRKDYREVVDKFKSISKIGRGETLEEWEDKTTRKKQAACLNKLRKKLGYTKVENV